MYVLHRNNSSPRGDGNLWRCARNTTSGETTHPREGTETQSIRFWISPSKETTHPREGTETPPIFFPFVDSIETTHPREGTETKDDVHAIWNIIRNNSSPRGDGNPKVSTAFDVLFRNNSSPRGDGNTPRLPDRPTTAETTHPREGTETDNCRALDKASWKQLIPARGRKQAEHAPYRHIGQKQLIPARGRKRCR